MDQLINEKIRVAIQPLLARIASLEGQVKTLTNELETLRTKQEQMNAAILSIKEHQLREIKSDPAQKKPLTNKKQPAESHHPLERSAPVKKERVPSKQHGKAQTTQAQAHGIKKDNKKQALVGKIQKTGKEVVTEKQAHTEIPLQKSSQLQPPQNNIGGHEKIAETIEEPSDNTNKVPAVQQAANIEIQPSKDTKENKDHQQMNIGEHHFTETAQIIHQTASKTIQVSNEVICNKKEECSQNLQQPSITISEIKPSQEEVMKIVTPKKEEEVFELHNESQIKSTQKAKAVSTHSPKQEKMSKDDTHLKGKPTTASKLPDKAEKNAKQKLKPQKFSNVKKQEVRTRKMTEPNEKNAMKSSMIKQKPEGNKNSSKSAIKKQQPIHKSSDNFHKKSPEHPFKSDKKEELKEADTVILNQESTEKSDQFSIDSKFNPLTIISIDEMRQTISHLLGKVDELMKMMPELGAPINSKQFGNLVLTFNDIFSLKLTYLTDSLTKIMVKLIKNQGMHQLKSRIQLILSLLHFLSSSPLRNIEDEQMLLKESDSIEISSQMNATLSSLKEMAKQMSNEWRGLLIEDLKVLKSSLNWTIEKQSQSKEILYKQGITPQNKEN